MLQKHPNYSLKTRNSFGFDVKCNYFFEADSESDLIQLFSTREFAQLPTLIIGGGCNLLFVRDFEGCVVHPALTHIHKLDETATDVLLQVGAGVVWDDFVLHCVENEYYGAENLSHIPGCVGASPVQNIGAYGVEAKDIIHSLTYIDTSTGALQHLSGAACELGYRDSIFKHALKNRACITQVVFRLSKQANLQTHYGNVSQELKKYDEVNLRTVRQAIIDIRRSKLPDPAVWGNAGSFFKNPLVPSAQAAQLLQKYPAMPTYASTQGVKIPAAWLIEQCGWKGKRQNNVGVHPQQPLVLVNYGGATGQEVLNLAHNIVDSVQQQFEIPLQMEVCVIN